jgi:hypothetical protein
MYNDYARMGNPFEINHGIYKLVIVMSELKVHLGIATGFILW